MTTEITTMTKEMNLVISVRDQASATLKNIGNSLASIGKQAAGFALDQMGVDAGSALKAAGEAFIGYNAKMQQTKIGFETMLGSAGAADYMLRQMADFAATTPFEFKEVTTAAQQFLAFGWAAKDVIPTLTAVGNAASGLGIGAEGINRITLAMGQMKAKGQVQGEELLQLTEAGIPAYTILAEKLHLTGAQVADIGNQGIKADDAIAALVAGMNEKFPNAMKKQSDSVIGMFKIIKDNAAIIFRGLGQNMFNTFDGGIKKVRDFANGALAAFRGLGSAGLINYVFGPEWGARIWAISDILSEFLDVGVKIGAALAAGFLPVLGTMADIFITVSSFILPALSTLIDFGMNNIPLLEGAVAAVATAFVLMNAGTILATIAQAGAAISSAVLTASYIAEALAIGEIGIAIDLLLGPIGWAALAVGALVAAFRYFTTGDNMEKIKKYFNEIGIALEILLGPIFTVGKTVYKLIEVFDIFTKSDTVKNTKEAAAGYAEGFFSAGSAADDAAGKVNKLIETQALYLRLKQGSGVRGEYEDKVSRDLASQKDQNQSDFLNHKGTASPSFTPSTKGADEVENAAKKMKEVTKDLSLKIAEETQTTFAFSIIKLGGEIEKIQKDIDDAKKTGVDVTKPQATLNDYQKTMENKYEEEQKKAQAALAIDIKAINADVTDNKIGAAEAQYDAALEGIEEEKKAKIKSTGDIVKAEEWAVEAKRKAEKEKTEAVRAAQAAQKALEIDIKTINAAITGDKKVAADAQYEAALAGIEAEKEVKKQAGLDQATINAWEVAAKRKAEKEKTEAVRAAQDEEFNMKLEHIVNMGTIENKRAAEVRKQLQKELEDRKKELTAELADFKGTADAKAKKEKELANTITQIKKNNEYNLKGGAEAAIDEIKDKTLNYKDLIVGTWNDISNSVSEHFTNIIKGSESLSDGLKGIFRGISDAIVKMFIDIAIQQLILAPLAGMFSSFIGNTFNLPQQHAMGGDTYPGNDYLVGEHGPEVLRFGKGSSGGRIIPNNQMGGGRSIVMNITTPDANSFRQSQGQIMAGMNVALASGRRFL